MDQIHRYYRYFYEKNIGTSMIPVDADFSKYKMVVAPVLYMVKPGMKEALEEYVKNGGILVTTYMSGIVGESDNVYLGGYPGPLKEMAGVWVEEIDALAPEQHNIVTFKDRSRSKCKIVCDLMHLEGAESLGEYTEDFYAGMPAVTRHSYGKGKLYYIGTCMEEDGIAKILSMAVEDAGAEPVAGAGNGLDIVKRNRERKSFYFVMNFRDEELEIPEEFAGKTDLLSGNAVGKGEKLPKFGVKIVVE